MAGRRYLDEIQGKPVNHWRLLLSERLCSCLAPDHRKMRKSITLLKDFGHMLPSKMTTAVTKRCTFERGAGDDFICLFCSPAHTSVAESEQQ